MFISTEMIQLLSQVGYLACFNGDVENGQMIMESVEKNCAGQPAAMIGVAISKIYAGMYPDAARILKETVLEAQPENMTAKCFLGIALFEAVGKDEAQELFNEIVEKGSDDDKTIASFYLAELNGTQQEAV